MQLKKTSLQNSQFDYGYYYAASEDIGSEDGGCCTLGEAS